MQPFQVPKGIKSLLRGTDGTQIFESALLSDSIEVLYSLHYCHGGSKAEYCDDKSFLAKVVIIVAFLYHRLRFPFCCPLHIILDL